MEGAEGCRVWGCNWEGSGFFFYSAAAQLKNITHKYHARKEAKQLKRQLGPKIVFCFFKLKFFHLSKSLRTVKTRVGSSIYGHSLSLIFWKSKQWINICIFKIRIGVWFVLYSLAFCRQFSVFIMQTLRYVLVVPLSSAAHIYLLSCVSHSMAHFTLGSGRLRHCTSVSA